MRTQTSERKKYSFNIITLKNVILKELRRELKKTVKL